MLFTFLQQTIRNFRRKIGAAKLIILRKLGIFFCRDCIQVDCISAKKIEKDREGEITISIFLDENILAASSSLSEAGQEVESLKPLIAQTETVLMDIKNTKFSFRNNHLIDNRNNVLYEPEISFDALPIYTQKLLPTTRFKGTVAYLSNTNTSNYYHWMCLTLPLLRIYQKYLDLKNIDFFYVGEAPLTNFQKETLLKVGISIDQVIQKGCKSDRLIVAIPYRKRYYGHGPIDEETYIFIRNMYYDDLKVIKNSSKKRLYVARGESKKRKVVNEVEVYQLLNKYNFDIVVMDGKTVREQAEIFYQAEVIIAPHGAALTNLLFVQPKLNLLEIFPDSYFPNYYYVMSRYAKANYFYMKGKSLNYNYQGNIDDILINLGELEKFCKDVCC